MFTKVVLNTVCNKTLLTNVVSSLSNIPRIYAREYEKNQKTTATEVEGSCPPADQTDMVSTTSGGSVSQKGLGSIFDWILSERTQTGIAENSATSNNINTSETAKSCVTSKNAKSKTQLTNEVQNAHQSLSAKNSIVSTASDGSTSQKRSSGIFNWIFSGSKVNETAQNCVASKNTATAVSAENCAESKKATKTETDLEHAVKSELQSVGQTDMVSAASGVCASQESNGGSGNIFNWILNGLKESEFAKHCVASKNIVTNVSAESCAKFKKALKTEFDFEREVKSTRPTASDMVSSTSGGYTSQKTSIFDWMLSNSKQSNNTQNSISSNSTITTESTQNCVSQPDSESAKNSAATNDNDLPLFHLFV